jgi:hypothetical protein
MTRSFVRSLGLGALLLLVLGAPVCAENAIQAGVDLWSTASGGRTYTSFASDPIPAGFFCPDSKPFAGRIAFKGAPLAVEPAKSLGQTDTIVRRLDDAAFDDKGEAVTRIQLMALSLVGEKPIDTGCGLYEVAASLDGEQPTTTMRIVKSAANGGSYIAPLALNVKLAFKPVAEAKGTARALTRKVTLGPSTNALWSYTTAPAYEGRVIVDTDGDGKPDTALPKPSNFVAGFQPAATTSPSGPVVIAPCRLHPDATSCPPGYCLWEACHCNPNKETWDPYDEGEGCTYLHCLWVCLAAPGSPGGPTPCAVIGTVSTQ